MPFESRLTSPSSPWRIAVCALATALAFGTIACDNDAVEPSAGDRIALGTWGAKDAGVIVSDSGTHVHVGCTLGDMPGLVPLDANGRFTIDGSYVLTAYPVMIGPTFPAQFSGQVVGRTLTMAIAVNDTVSKRVVALGPITVVLGAAPTMGPCPICRVGPRYLRINAYNRTSGIASSLLM